MVAVKKTNNGWAVRSNGHKFFFNMEYRAEVFAESHNTVHGMLGPKKSDFIAASTGYPQFVGRQDYAYITATMK